MKTEGNVTTFEHVSRRVTAQGLREGRALLIAEFDGEIDLWETRQAAPTTAQLKVAMAELGDYYRRDWAGTGRQIPVVALRMVGHSVIRTG